MGRLSLRSKSIAQILQEDWPADRVILCSVAQSQRLQRKTLDAPVLSVWGAVGSPFYRCSKTPCADRTLANKTKEQETVNVEERIY